MQAAVSRSGGSKGDAMGSAVLGEAISAIRDWSVVSKKEPGDARAANLFGSLVFNDGAASLDIFPVTGGQIDALGANAAYSLASGSVREFHGKTATDWRSK